jgi:hypothetical protein
VFVGLYGNDWDAHIARGEADPQSVIHDVPNLGQRALYVTVSGQEDGELFVKADSTHGFAVKLSSFTDNPQQREIAVVNLVLSRIQNG